MVGLSATEMFVELNQTGVISQRSHVGEGFDDVGCDGGFAGADYGDADVPAADVVQCLMQVVVERSAGTEVGAGIAHAAEHVGIDEVSRHFTEAERQLFRRNLPAEQAGFQQAAVTIVVKLVEAAAGVDRNLIGRNNLLQRVPVEPERVQGIRGGI